MSAIVDFYRGEGTDHRGRTFADYMSFDDNQLEDIHDYIQWLFPDIQPSAYNKNAPVLTKEDIKTFLNDETIHRNISKAFELMWKFYFSYNIDQYHWISENNHNFLRLTRILRFLNIVDRPAIADYLFQHLLKVYVENINTIDNTTLRYWLDASEFKP